MKQIRYTGQKIAESIYFILTTQEHKMVLDNVTTIYMPCISMLHENSEIAIYVHYQCNKHYS